MTNLRPILLILLILLIPVLLGGCQHPEIIDHGGVCVTGEQTGDQHMLVVVADSQDCASDHKGVSFECSISVDGSVAHIETIFVDGKDPNDACAHAIVTSCEVEVEPGSYTIEFADQNPQAIDVPSDQAVCLGGVPGDTG